MKSSFHNAFYSLCLKLSLCIIVSFFFLFFRELPAEPYPVKASRPGIYLDLGSKLVRCGHFKKAILILTEASGLFQKNGQYEELGQTFIQLSKAYQSTGAYHQSIEMFEKALSLASKSKKPILSARAYASGGRTYQYMGKDMIAEDFLKKGLMIAQEEKNLHIVALILNELANLYAKHDEYPKAMDACESGLNAAEKAQNHVLIAHIYHRKAKIHLKEKHYHEARKMLEGSFQKYIEANCSHDVAFGLINIAQSYRSLSMNMAGPGSTLQSRASHILKKASGIADAINDRYALSYAFGYLGRIYEDKKAYDKALYYTRKAIFTAQETYSPESLYLWQWQLGRLFQTLNKINDAVSAHREAVMTLQSIKHEGFVSCAECPGTFLHKGTEAVYFRLADLLLQKASMAMDQEEMTSCLAEARDTIERLKSVELQNYFQDPCLGEYESKLKCIDTVSDQTAIIYIIPLNERIELILTLPGEMKRFSVQIPYHMLAEQVRELRMKLEKRTTREYLFFAQNLYDYLIRPLENHLASNMIDTLVFIPDGSLRSVPMSVLHDGTHFLIENFAIAYTLSLQLTDPRPIQRKKIRLLLAGVTQPVHGFPSLSHADYEIQNIFKHFKGTLLLNQDCLIPKIKQELGIKPYSIVHIVSHGVFNGNAEKSFLLTWDGEIAMSLLDHLVSPGRYRKNPIELLTLSACQTAAGDDRAALGLAGIAIKAGARSALATIWHIDDMASSELIIAFYKQLGNPLITKAKSLQVAQLQLMRDDRFEHPCYWAPFLLIGNWL